MSFCRRHFSKNFYDRKFVYFHWKFPEFIPEGPIADLSSLVQIMVWHLFDARPLSDLTLTKALYTPYGVTRPQWDNSIKADSSSRWEGFVYIYIYESLNTLRPRQNGRRFQMTFFKCIFLNEKFQIKFHWSLFLRVQLTIFQHWFRQWPGADQATSHCLNQCWLVYRCIYSSLRLNELS